jgi:hypothetical protein
LIDGSGVLSYPQLRHLSCWETALPCLIASTVRRKRRRIRRKSVVSIGSYFSHKEGKNSVKKATDGQAVVVSSKARQAKAPDVLIP